MDLLPVRLPTLENFAKDLGRGQKSLLVMVFDFFAVAFSLWAAAAIRLGDLWPADIWRRAWWVLFLMPIIAVVIYRQAGVYRQVLRSVDADGIIRISQATAGISVLLAALSFFIGYAIFPRSTPIIFCLVAVASLVSGRWLARKIYEGLIRSDVIGKPVVIYGAGSAGMQLLAALRVSESYEPVAFVDEDPALRNSLVGGRRVYNAAQIDHLIERYQVQDIFLAMPSVDKSRKKEILLFLTERQLRVKEVPPIHELIDLVVDEQQLRAINVEDLLGRDIVPPDPDLFECVRGRNILITGAGGSIGSELARQIMTRSPRIIVLFEMAEFALYSIERELLTFPEAADVEIVPVLGSVCNGPRLASKIALHDIQTLFHAAAYKHVPLVEGNPVEGIRNNTIGTYEVAKAAVEAGVDRVILISTDKAVRPANILGASKRMAERAFQYWQTKTSKTVLCMVRFGNVIGSSGSVVPLFRTQIDAGGPVTVTHPEVVRYFMTIPEAAQLVVQAGSMGVGSDVFLLDMGAPVSIRDLARRMIHLSGSSVKDESNPDGDIEIKFIGLRPGEKLYEELLIDGTPQETRHPKIMRESISHVDVVQLEKDFIELEQAVDVGDEETARNLLFRYVEGFADNSEKARKLRASLS